MDDEADLKKIIDVINSAKEDSEDDVQYREYINYVESDDDEDDEFNEQEFDFAKPVTIDVSTLYKYNPTSSLQPEERATIDSCTDPELKNLLLLNRQKNMQLIQLYKKFKDLLIECKQNILEKNEVVKQYHEASSTQRKSSGSWKVCAPYFKDKDFYICPQNPDTIKKKNNKELSYYDMMPIKKWSPHEFDVLSRAVKLNFTMNVVANIKKRIKLIQSGAIPGVGEEEENELKEQLNKLSKPDNFVIPPLGSDENINWIRVADVFIKDRHSDFECRSCWHLFLHPSINRGPWTPEENKKLNELVTKYQVQRWDDIILELGTNRTAFEVVTHYFCKNRSAFKKGEFTFNEDKKLLSLVKKYRMGNHIPWVKIVRHFKNRTRSQIHHRYTYYLSQIDKKRGKFTEAEDALVLLCIEKFGLNFRKCCEFLPQRSIIQIKSRYSSNLRGILKKGTWSVEEDKILLDFANKNKHSKGVPWTDLVVQMERSRGQIRQRYTVIKTYLDENPGSTLEDVPRRKHKHKIVEDTYYTVRRVVDHFMEQNSIPSLEEIELFLKNDYTFIKTEPKKDCIKEPIKDKNVDDSLTEYFSNYLEQPIKNLSALTLNKAVEEVELILDVLKVNLDIPENLDQLPNLDNIDIDILSVISKNVPKRPKHDIKRIVPANFHTANMMKSILIKYMHFKNEKMCKSQFLTLKNEQIFGNFDNMSRATLKSRLAISEELSERSVLEKQKIEADRILFYKRFLSLFKFPAVLTLEAPSKELMSITQNITEDFRPRPSIKRTYSRKQKSDGENASKCRIVDGNAAKSLKLTPVTSTSVIANLIADTSKKLFSMDKVQSDEGTKTLVKEVDLEFLARKESCSQTLTKPYAKLNRTEDDIKLDAGLTKNNNLRAVVKLEAPSTLTSSDDGSMNVTEDVDMDQMSFTESQIFADDDDFIDLEKLKKFLKKEKDVQE